MIRIQADAARQSGKDRNATLLFDLVRRLAPISRAELAKTSGLSPATVTVLVDELLQGGWLVELGVSVSEERRGRRPVNLAINARRGAVATLEITGGGYILSVYDICLGKLAQLRSSRMAQESEPVIRQLRTQLEALSLADAQLLGIHVLYPGLFDRESGRLGFSAVIENWRKSSPTLLRDLREAFASARVMLSNSAAATAYSAFVHDMREPPLPLLVMTIQEGIDAGVILPGGQSIPVEAGHISIDRCGPLCNCGNRGCLETFCSATALLARLKAAGFTPSGEVPDGVEPLDAQLRQIAKAFFDGDAAVRSCLHAYARDLDCALVSLVNLLGVRAVRLGGLPQQLGAPFLLLLQRTLRQEFHVLTASQQLDLQLFDCRAEDVRQAAVMQTLQAIFSRT